MPALVEASETSRISVPTLYDGTYSEWHVDDSWPVRPRYYFGMISRTGVLPRSRPKCTSRNPRKSFCVAFKATQREVRSATQQTNFSAVLNEDYVGVYLSPEGSSGITYAFFLYPRAPRYQTPSENTAYSRSCRPQPTDNRGIRCDAMDSVQRHQSFAQLFMEGSSSDR